MKNFYVILGVKNTADLEEIKSAYRALAKKHHPDKNLGDAISEERFKEIQEAYNVLSNPEKRKKYDLKFSYSSSYKSRSTNSGTYTGNAYQYAQQQAQQKQQQPYQRTPKEEKIDKSENYYILVSVGVAMILLYFIISYSSDTGIPVVPAGTTTRVAPKPEVNTEPAIHDFDSPYTAVFGEEVADLASKNCININNVSGQEAVVCLVENKEPYKTIRNQYMSPGSSFKMNGIPDGEYFMKIYFGNFWDASKTFGIENAKGGFLKGLGFMTVNTGANAFKMKQTGVGNSVSYSSYDIELYPYKDSLSKSITATEFFK